MSSDRLRLREFSQGDLDDLAALVADPAQMTFYERPKTREEASAWLARNLAFYEEKGFGFWVIELLATSEFAGYCGIRPLDLDGVSEIEIGWHVKKTFWNRGVATEAAIAARGLAFTSFGMSRLVALIPPDHLGSRRVAEKIGMHPERNTVLEGEDLVVYAATLDT